MEIIASYNDFSPKKCCIPWVAEVNHTTGKPDFTKKIGGYTGGITGEAGDLFVSEPKVNQVYMYGHRMRYKNISWNYYAYWDGEDFIELKKSEVISKIKHFQNI